MKKFLLLVTCMLPVAALFAQRTVTGNITDEKGMPLNNVSVSVRGSTAGTTSKSDGTFTLTLPPNAKTIVISAVGRITQEMAIEGKTEFNISLQPEDRSLNEVVVVGYTNTTKQAFTGSARVVSGDVLNNKSVSNISQALAGEVAGLRVINTSGQPGTVATIRIRGVGSVNGNRDPLYVVDGIPYSGVINSINQSDIESVTALKDAAATAIYGSRGANGVIVITTRTGKGRKSFIEVDGRFGTNRALLPRYDVLTSPEEYIALSWEALYNNGVAVGNANPVNYANVRLFSSAGISPNNNIWNVTNGGELIDPDTRKVRSGVARKFDPEIWEDYAFQPANRTEANVRFGGGDGKTNYYTSFGYLDDVGYSVNSDFKRLTGRLNLTHEVKSWLSAGMNVSYANAVTNRNGQGRSSNSIFWFVDNMPPIYPLFLRDADGNKVPDPIFGGHQYDYGLTGRKFSSFTNSIADATFNTIRNTRNAVDGNASVKMNFTKSLSLVNRLGMQYFNDAGVNRQNKFYGSSAPLNGSLVQEKTERMNLNLLNMLRYARGFGAHNIEVLAAHEATKFKESEAGASGYNLVENNSLELSNAIVKEPTSYSFTEEYKLESYFGQVNYDYEGTYYFAGTVRRDGSSRFSKGKTWGSFGSIGLGWVLSKMNFMQKLKIIDYLKVKASYGVLGDQDGVEYYDGYSRIDIGNLNDNPSFGIPEPGNPALTWETSKMFQAGVEFRLGSFLTGAIDYYVKNTDNLVFERRVGISNGYALIKVNDGQLRNQGIEFDITGHIIRKRDFFLNIGINGEHFRSQITAMPLDPSTGTNKIIDVQSDYGWAKGHSVYDFYAREFAGVDPAMGTSTWTVYYDDLNSNGAFDAGEQVASLEDFYAQNPDKKDKLSTGVTSSYAQATLFYTGQSGIPKLRGAFSLNGGFRGFQLDIQFLYSLGGYAYDETYAGLMDNTLVGSYNWHTDIRKRWQNPGDITDVPRISNRYDVNVVAPSTRFITKASYLSLNNIRLGYTLPATVIQKIGQLEEVSFFVSGDNLWLLSARKGFNPSMDENGSSDTYHYSPLSTITAGLKIRF